MVTARSKGDYMDVGVRDLKAKLSEYLERASAGEVITVTDRGQPKAVLARAPVRNRHRARVLWDTHHV